MGFAAEEERVEPAAHCELDGEEKWVDDARQNLQCYYSCLILIFRRIPRARRQMSVPFLNLDTSYSQKDFPYLYLPYFLVV